MMKIKLVTDKAKELKQFFAALSSLVDELQLHFTKSGIYMKMLDPSGIAMIEGNLKRSLFSEWNIKKDQVITIYEKLLNNVLENIKKDDILTITNAESGSQKALKFKLSKKNEEFEIPYFEMNDKQPKHPLHDPKEDFTAKLSVPSQQLKEVVNSTKKINPYLMLLAEKGKLILFSKGDSGKIKKVMPGLKGEIKEQTYAMYNREYINKMLKGADKNNLVEIAFRKDKPLQISYKTDYWDMKYWLAPMEGTEDSAWLKELNETKEGITNAKIAKETKPTKDKMRLKA